MASESHSSRYHPDFSGEQHPCTDFTVTLVSRDKMRFRVRASALRAASHVFETTLSLPQPEESVIQEPVIDNLDEDATTIEGLLRMITGKQIPPLKTLEVIETLALAADKWDMPGPLSILRILLLRDRSFVEGNPIKLYWLGCRLGWKDLSNLACRYSCNADILYTPALEALLRTLASGDLLRLFKFHRKRRDRMITYFETGTLAEVLKGELCIHSSQFQDLRSRYLESMDFTPPEMPPSEVSLRQMISRLRLDSDPPKCSVNEWLCRPTKHTVDSLADAVIPALIAQWSMLPQDIFISEFEKKKASC